MANEPLANRCALCGALFSMVGRIHRCVPRPAAEPVPAVESTVGTYRYRDPDKRRAYMRDYMRRVRHG